jgi:hypothetical protein
VSEKGNFWGVFYRPLLDRVRHGETEVRPIFIDDYLNMHGAHGYVKVREGAWNTGWHHGTGFVQWTGSQTQKDALWRVGETSKAIHMLRDRASKKAGNGQVQEDLEEAYWRLLRAETSCNFFWGEAWVERCHKDLNDAWALIHKVQSALPDQTTPGINR